MPPAPSDRRDADDRQADADEGRVEQSDDRHATDISTQRVPGRLTGHTKLARVNSLTRPSAQDRIQGPSLRRKKISSSVRIAAAAGAIPIASAARPVVAAG
jgi:hypothetical protein